MPTRVLIVDDHEDFRASARALLAAEGYEIVGEAEDGESGLAEARRLSPDVVLLDVQLPGVDGFEVARRLLGEPVPPAVVLVSSRSAAEYGARVGDTPAEGFISKGDLSGAALAAVLRGS